MDYYSGVTPRLNAEFASTEVTGRKPPLPTHFASKAARFCSLKYFGIAADWASRSTTVGINLWANCLFDAIHYEVLTICPRHKMDAKIVMSIRSDIVCKPPPKERQKDQRLQMPALFHSLKAGRQFQ
jgi:hypothetical protein